MFLQNLNAKPFPYTFFLREEMVLVCGPFYQKQFSADKTVNSSLFREVLEKQAENSLNP